MSIKDSILSHINQFNHYKEENKKLKRENKKLKDENRKIKEDMEDLNKYETGISIIIPTFKGEDHIRLLLESLEKQTLDPALYELIFVFNGELDSTMDILNEFIKDNPQINITSTFTLESGASNARNIGMELARKEYLTFVDDDDFISPNYLEKLLEHSKPNRITMANFLNYDSDTGEAKSTIPSSVKEYGIIKNAPISFMSQAAVTVAKTIPTCAAKRIKFNANLTSGEDVSFYGNLYSKFDFEFYFINKEEEANYYRIQRNISVSQQEMTYQFNVLDRLKVMDDLDESYRNVENKKIKKYLEMCFAGQTGFIQRYLQKHPEDKDKVLEEVKKHDFKYFPYSLLEN